MRCDARYALQRTVPGVAAWDRISLAMTANAPPGNPANDENPRTIVIKDRRKRDLLMAGALQNAILNSAGFSSIATDARGVIQIFNAGAKRMLGYTGAEVVNKLTPADFSDALEVVERAKALSLEFGTAIAPGFEALVFKASRGIEDRYELTCIRKDGGRLPATVSVTALHDPSREIVGYLLIATDDTARKEAEEQRRQADAGFRLMVESVADCAIVQLDRQGRVLSWNAGAQIIDGFSAQEIVGQHFSRFYSCEDLERGAPQRDLDAAAATGRCETQGWRARKDGSTYRANIVLTSIRDEAGVLRGFARLARDVTRDMPGDSGEPPQQEAPPAAPLPAANAAPKSAVERSKPAFQPWAQKQPRSKLLYIDDHPASVALVEQLVARRTDVLLLRAADANLGIELARAERPDVILLNIDLPGMSALQFMALLRADPATQNTPLLALSGNAAPAAITKGLLAGFFQYLTRPLKAEAFMEALGDALEFAARERAEENDMPSRGGTETQRSTTC
jgi:PAS domain S-box-containing protein